MQVIELIYFPGFGKKKSKNLIFLILNKLSHYNFRLFSELNNPGSASTVGDPVEDPLPKFIHCPNCSSTSLVSQTKVRNNFRNYNLTFACTMHNF